MPVFDAEPYDDHEQVIFCRDPATNLKAIIAIHSTALGMAVGGCRMWDYQSEAEALTDVLRLSRGMSFKNALAGLDLGGGKTVVIGDPQQIKTPELLQSLGRFIQSLGGRYATGEDVGISVEDMEHIAATTDYVGGRASGLQGSGDPSYFTALGVYLGATVALRHRLKVNNFEGQRVAIQGLGNVGFQLAERLAKEGAKIVVSDVREERVERAVNELGASAVSPEAIVHEDVDVFSPCALGAVINDDTASTLKASIVAGAANNQLALPSHGEILRQRNILYAPDYVINAGGIRNAASEFYGTKYSRESGTARVEGISEILLQIFEMADQKGLSTAGVADDLAAARLHEAASNTKQVTN